MYKTLGGRVECVQCDAKSKRSGERCRAPAVKNKTKCRFHGGAKGSGRPITHGRETRASRIEASKAKARIRALEDIGFNIDMFAPESTRTRGPKPKSSAGALDTLVHLSSLGIWSVKD
jgi:glucans biosynthesis protein